MHGEGDEQHQEDRRAVFGAHGKTGQEHVGDEDQGYDQSLDACAAVATQAVQYFEKQYRRTGENEDQQWLFPLRLNRKDRFGEEVQEADPQKNPARSRVPDLPEPRPRADPRQMNEMLAISAERSASPVTAIHSSSCPEMSNVPQSKFCAPMKRLHVTMYHLMQVAPKTAPSMTRDGPCRPDDTAGSPTSTDISK